MTSNPPPALNTSQELGLAGIENFINSSRTGSIEMREGDLCPRCREVRLDYDGLLNLSCPKCGFTLAGCFT
jgi:hypothetical protein